MLEVTTSKNKKSKRRNGDGTTYRYKNGWRTVITCTDSRYPFSAKPYDRVN